jgi:hypothetical protein
MPRTGGERRGRGRKDMPGTEATLSRDELDALPEGTARAFTLAPGVVLTFERTEGNTWRVHTRGGVPSSYLADRSSVLRVRRERDL